VPLRGGEPDGVAAGAASGAEDDDPPAQSLLLAHLEPGGTRPAQLARRLGTSRQAAAELLGGLERLGVVEVVDDPASRRGRLARLTPEGRRLAAAADRHLARLESDLRGRIGADAVADLRAALAAPWDPEDDRARLSSSAQARERQPRHSHGIHEEDPP
jgi:DNA-binding MarR family transcriptional regulator